METPENKCIRKRLGMTRSSSIKKNPLKNLQNANSPLTPSPAVKLIKKDTPKLGSENTLSTPLVGNVKLYNKEIATPSNLSEVKSITSTGSRKRNILSLGSSKTRLEIKKKKLDFVEKSSSSEKEEPKQEITEFSLTASDSDLELSAIDLPEEATGACEEDSKEITVEDVEKVKSEIEDLKKQLEIFDKRKQEIETLKGLINLWRKAGIEGLDMLISKTDPPQSVDTVLKCFNIPREMFFGSEPD